MPNIALPGIAATGVLGTPTITGGGAPQSISLPGIAASGTLGALTVGFVASGPQSIALSGITATGTLGVPTISFGAPPPSGGGGGVATPGAAPNRLPYPDVVRSSSTGEVLDPRGVQANFERLASQSAKGAATGADQAWQPLTLISPWANYGLGWDTLAYAIDANGHARLRGMIVPNSAPDAHVATLPVGARPPSSKSWAVIGFSGGTYYIGDLQVLSTGDINVHGQWPGTADWVSLGEREFRTA